MQTAITVGGVSRDDVRLDDFSANPNAWAVCGTGVKLINPHNGAGKKWLGPRVSFDTSPEQIENGRLLL